MPAGTIALTNNSTAVTGSGTNFSSELKANDFLVAIVGGVTYTLGVQSVNSATSVTLTTAYNGPTTSGLAWTAIPNAALVGITAQVAADVARAIRGLNLDKANWQQIFNGTGNVTVTLPDGTSWTGPAWNGIATTVSGKLDKSQNLNDLTDKAAARTNLGFVDGKLPISLGGTGGKTLSEAQSSLGIKPDAFSPGDMDVPWIVPTTGNGWSIAIPSVVRTGYRKVSGQVQMSVNVTANGAKNDGIVIFTIPASYAPNTVISVPSALSDLTTAARLEINPNGNVVCQGYSGSQRNMRIYVEYPLQL